MRAWFLRILETIANNALRCTAGRGTSACPIVNLSEQVAVIYYQCGYHDSACRTKNKCFQSNYRECCCVLLRLAVHMHR